MHPKAAGGLEAVAQILGAPRSGSSVLARLLGQVDGCFWAGEVRWLWWAAGKPDHLCGCGVSLLKCPIWSGVLDRLAAQGIHPEGAWELQRRALRTDRAWLQLGSMTTRKASPEEREFADVLHRTYSALSEITACRVVIDSSKRSNFALLQARGFNTVLVHLVRDPRGVVYSMYRRSLAHGNTAVPLKATLKSAGSWLVDNLAIEAVRRRRGTTGLLLHYEDFVTNPQQALARILNLVNIAPERWPVIDGGADFSVPSHSAHGNDHRFDAGIVPIRLDERWRTDLPRPHRLITGAVTAPGMAAWGYRP